jgi:tRNA pseudouridine38-40 synthase
MWRGISVLCFVACVEASSIRFRARVAYDGHGFQGFQLQTRKNCRTVQGVLEEVLNRRLLGLQEDHQLRVIKVVAAGRTDTGVHARGQAIHFDVPASCRRLIADPEQVCESLNQMLTPDVRLWNLQRVPPGLVTKPVVRALTEDDDDWSYTDDFDGEANEDFRWNVLYDSTKKLYSYRLSLASVMDPLQRYTRWHPVKAHTINVDKLQRILKQYEGTHDFRAFAGAIEQAEKRAGSVLSTIRTVYSVDLIHECPTTGNYRIDFLLKGALYKQVRNMVGTALDVCTGKVTEDNFLWLLRQDSQLTRVANRSKPAPPEGLTLEHVYFDDPTF